MTAAHASARDKLPAAAAQIDELRASPEGADGLAELLAEQSPVYAGLGTNEAERLRGYAMAGFERTGLPSPALPSVLETLRTSRSPYPLAASARALRGAETPPEDTAELLLLAIGRLRSTDDVVAFDRFDAYLHDPTAGPPVTALMELLRTLAWLGARARGSLDALQAMQAAGAFSLAVQGELAAAIAAIQTAPAASCCGTTTSIKSSRKLPTAKLGPIAIQDQDGAVMTFAEAFHGRPTVLAFFYTRCMNPDKCPLTVAKLGRLQRRLAAEGLSDRVNIAAITYDPAFDLPRRLRDYGGLLGLAFDARTRLWRTTGPFEPLRTALDLGVGYGPATVNQHRIDLFVLDAACRVADAITRRLWEVDEVVDLLRRQLEAACSRAAARP